jgi:hypothetical protein
MCEALVCLLGLGGIRHPQFPFISFCGPKFNVDQSAKPGLKLPKPAVRIKDALGKFWN